MTEQTESDTSVDSSTKKTDHEEGEGEAFQINDPAPDPDEDGNGLQRRFDEEDQGKSWEINENTASDDD